MTVAESKNNWGNGSESEDAAAHHREPPTMYDVYQYSQSIQPKQRANLSGTTVSVPSSVGTGSLDLRPLDSHLSTGSGIYFEDHEVPLSQCCPKKRSRPVPLVEGKAMLPPPALFHDHRILKKQKKRSSTPVSVPQAVTYQGVIHHGVNHQMPPTPQDAGLQYFVEEDAGFREAAFALTNLCHNREPTREVGGHRSKPPPAMMQPPPRLGKGPML